MRNSSLINVVLTIIMLFSMVVIFSVLNVKRVYQQDSQLIQSKLADPTIVNYFKSDRLTEVYETAEGSEDIVYSPICVDCDETIANMYNAQSVLIVESPEDICDTEVERCIVYEFDPFGLGLFTKEQIIRNTK